MDFKINLHNCSPAWVDVQFETIVQIGSRSKVKVMQARHVVPGQPSCIIYLSCKLWNIQIYFESFLEGCLVALCSGNQFHRLEDASIDHLLCRLCNRLNHYQTTNFRLFRTERVCKRQFQIWQKWRKVIQMGRKHCGIRRNCSLRAIFPFPTVFSKGLFPRGVKRCRCVGMG